VIHNHFNFCVKKRRKDVKGGRWETNEKAIAIMQARNCEWLPLTK
jgi:hypothetical protein